MNLNISYNWLKEYVKTGLSAQEFAKAISLVGPSVDHITEIKPNFEKVVVGQIKSIEQHPDADKLHVCKVNVGKAELQIVCGAPNIKEGQKVPVVLVGGKVGDFEIKAAKLRGVESFGMMCSQKELGLGEDHTGIFILPDYVAIGEKLEKIMPIEDTILDVEVTSNRPDAMCIIGLAREASAALNEKFAYHEPKPNLNIKGKCEDLKVKVAEPKLCPRYMAVPMTEVKVEASPLWLQQRLMSAGLRPINNLVDITNYILLEFGQPMHVFDYDKLQGKEINVRYAKAGEKILALDGKEYELAGDQLVIADAKAPIAVAGVMGGELSAVSTETKTIVFECATFDSVSIRKTSRALNLRSESSALYEKGLHAENTHPALMRAIELAIELTGGKIACEIYDVNNHKSKTHEIKLDLDALNSLLGVKIKPAEVKASLTSLGFKVSSTKTKKDEFIVEVPYWRENDIEGEHDLAEEVARLHGYHNLPTNLMAGELPTIATSAEFHLENSIKDMLVGFGLTEIYTYSFISERAIINAGFKPTDCVKINNPLSADFEYMRTSLIPGALQIISENQNFYPEESIFDLSKVYLPAGENDLPNEIYKLLIASYGPNQASVTAKAKGILDALITRLNIDNYSIKQTGDRADILASGVKIGEIFAVNPKVLSACGIKKNVAMVELDFSELMNRAKSAPAYQAIAKFPSIDLDLSVEIDRAVKFGDVVSTIGAVDSALISGVQFLSVYEGEKIAADKKALAVRISYRDLERTLESADAQKAHDKVVAKLKKEYNIVVR